MGIRPAREVIPLAKAAEHKALRIDPSLPEAHALLGVCAGTFDFDWREAERHWRQAMAHGPESRDIRFWYGNHYLLPIGRPLEAVEAMEWGLQEDPLNLLYRHHLAVGFRHVGRLGDAEDELRKVLEIDEQFPLALGTLGAICAQQNRFEEALVWTERASAAMPWSQLITGQLAALLARAGSTAPRGRAARNAHAGTACGAPTALAIYYAMGGDLDQAAHWAERAIDERFPPLVAMLGPLLRGHAEVARPRGDDAAAGLKAAVASGLGVSLAANDCARILPSRTTSVSVRELVEVVGGLRGPQHVRVLAVDRLVRLAMGHAGLAELGEHLLEERPDRRDSLERTVRREQDGVRRVVGEDPGEVAGAETLHMMIENGLG